MLELGLGWRAIPFYLEGKGEGRASCSLFETTQLFSQYPELREQLTPPCPMCPISGAWYATEPLVVKVCTGCSHPYRPAGKSVEAAAGQMTASLLLVSLLLLLEF